MTGITRLPGMTRLQGEGVYIFLNKTFKDIFSRTHFPFFKDSNQRLESMTFNVLRMLCCIISLFIKLAKTLNEEAAKLRISEN